MLAQQLADRGANAEVTYIDVSRAALGIARARARARRLRNVRFLRASLFDAGRTGRSTTSIAAVSSTISTTRRPGCARWRRRWPTAAGWG